MNDKDTTETVGSVYVDDKLLSETNETEVEKDLHESSDETCVAEEATELDENESAENSTEPIEIGTDEVDRVVSESMETNDSDITEHANAMEEAMVAAPVPPEVPDSRDIL